jgi:N-dimethylarginine dimethylaminohydrolase
MYQSEVAPLKRVLMKHPRDAFFSQARIAEQWQALGYSGPPDFDAACREADALAALLERLGATVDWMPANDVGLDSVYARDASLVSNAGTILARMGKGPRSAEPEAVGREYPELGMHVLGSIEQPGTLEGGDVTWLGDDTLAVGRGYRTNAEGIAQLRALLGEDVEVIEVPLPHWKGPGDVFHLMSMLSPLAEDLLLVYSRLLPVPFREQLLSRGFELVNVPDDEFEMGCNVLAAAPRVAVALEGFPETCRRMEAAGVEVHTYSGAEISARGHGGPTCLTRTLERAT